MHIQIRTILIDNARLLIIKINPKSTSSKRRRVALGFMQNFHKTSSPADVWFSKNCSRRQWENARIKQ